MRWLLIGCSSSGLDFGAPIVPEPLTGTSPVSTSSTDSADTAAHDTDADADSDADSDADADADADSDADTDADGDADTDTGLPVGPPLVGTYVGEIVIAYTSTIPIFGGSSTCTGTMTVAYDPLAGDPIVGSFSCDWPVLDLWAALWLDEVEGNIRGDGGIPAVDGDISGEDGFGTFAFDDPWAGAIAGDRMIGTFAGGSFLVDDYSGSWDLTWVF